MTVDSSKTVPMTTFSDDDGSADPHLEAALAAYERGDGGPADVLTALAGARLLVPVLAVRDDAEADDAAERPGGFAVAAEVDGEKSSHMATASTIGRDGRRGLLAFTSLDSMYRWNPDARPVPVPTRSAAEAAVADGADALVIDLAGPVLFSVDAEGLRTLASGWRPVMAWGSG